MAAELGNKYAVKLVSVELKKEAYEDYCKHVASGLSKDTWYFKDEKRLLCTYKCIEAYMKEDPVVFPPLHMGIAKCKSKGIWEEKGMQMMDGKRHCEPAIYQMFMRNKFDWDKPDKSIQAEEGKADLQQYANAVKQLRVVQTQEQVVDRSELQQSVDASQT